VGMINDMALHLLVICLVYAFIAPTVKNRQGNKGVHSQDRAHG
jgi:hypothetical protein